MERAYAAEGVQNGQIILDQDEAHHLTKVRRVAIGELIEVFDGQGHAWRARLAEATKKHALLMVEDDAANLDFVATSPNSIEVWVATAVPKGERFDWLIEKATELGVSRLIPLQCDRSVVEPRATKLDRLRRSVIEACKQCGRNELMEITPVEKLENFLKSLDTNDAGFFMDRSGEPIQKSYSASLKQKKPQRMIACIGPEGGWTADELNMAKAGGWCIAQCAGNILRVETAAIAAASVLGSMALATNDNPIIK